MDWPQVELGRVAKVHGGFGFPRDRQGRTDEEYPFFKVGDMNSPGNEVEMKAVSNSVSKRTLNDLGAKAFPPGTVIFPKIGAAIATEKKRILVTPATFDNNVMGVVPGAQVVSKYLFYWFQILRLQEVANQGPVPSIRKTAIEQLRVPLPPLSEQRRIVEILDQADHLRRLRTEANTNSDRVLPAVFLKMFGDPATNPIGWPMVTLGETLDAIEGGWSPRCESRPAHTGEWGVLKLGAVTWCTYQDSENKALPPNLEPRPHLEVMPDDILFARKNTHALVAACALVHSTRPKLMIPDLIFRLRLRADSSVLREYLAFLLGRTSMRAEIQKLASGAAGSMPNISRGRLISAEIPIPPLALQEQFASRYRSHSQIEAANKASSDRIHSLFAQLLFHAISGELTAHWRKDRALELQQEIATQTSALQGTV